MTAQSILILIVSLAALVYILWLVASDKLVMRVALMWILLSIILIICALFPGLIFALSDLLGFIAPSNLVFVIAIFYILFLLLSLTRIVSKQQTQIKELTQELAIRTKDKEI